MFENKHDKAFLSGRDRISTKRASAATVAFLNILTRDRILEKAAQSGNYLFTKLRGLDQDIIGNIRGKGMLACLELVKDKKTKEMFDPSDKVGPRIESRMLRRGVKIFGSTGFNTDMMSDFLFLAPPLTMTHEQIDRLVSSLDHCLGEEK